ncbi:hypothetical protein GHI93_12700, partial [Lactococcus hircilactis]|nr:hypothetical protein [Lactococcus hircilactis]
AEMLKLVSMNFHEYIPIDDLICSCSDGPITRNFEDVILMQSTGLHDDQGVEVFEGDLIHYTYEGFDWYIPVVYREGSFEVYHGTLSTIPASKIPSGKYTTNIGNSISMYRAEFTDMYVAGNIYENPELLEATK